MSIPPYLSRTPPLLNEALDNEKIDNTESDSVSCDIGQEDCSQEVAPESSINDSSSDCCNVEQNELDHPPCVNRVPSPTCIEPSEFANTFENLNGVFSSYGRNVDDSGEDRLALNIHSYESQNSSSCETKHEELLETVDEISTCSQLQDNPENENYALLSLKNDATAEEVAPLDGSSYLEDLEQNDFSDFADFQSSVPFSPELSEEPSVLKEPEEEFPIYDFDLEETDSSILLPILDNSLNQGNFWINLKYFEDTPAFKFNWTSSVANKKFLEALQIDSRNILHGPWARTTKLWTSDEETGRRPTQGVTQEGHIDWLNINPMIMMHDHENYEGEQTASDLQMRTNSDKFYASVNSVLESLPDLSFVKKPYIVFKKI